MQISSTFHIVYFDMYMYVLLYAYMHTHVQFFSLQFLVEKLFWPETPLLESVGMHEPQVNALRMEMCQAINRALIPLRAYAIKFEPHLELMNMDIKLFIQ